jgi:hypothetical protein
MFAGRIFFSISLNLQPRPNPSRYRGHITMTHSHYYRQSFSHRILGAYYLGCPMTKLVTAKNEQLIRVDKSDIWKDDLVVIDLDLIEDYPPEQAIEITLPEHYQIVYAKNLAHDELVTILQRAKVVII